MTLRGEALAQLAEMPSIASRPALIERLRWLKSALAKPVSRGRSTTSASRSSKLLMLRPMIAKVCSSMRIASPVGLPSGGAEMSTAITNSAPIWRAKRTGTGATRPPSTYSRLPMRTGWNTAGTALDARTAAPGSPRWNRMAWPLSRSVATMPSGRRICSIGRPPVLSRTYFARVSPRISPRPGNDQSVNAVSSIVSARAASSGPPLPDAYSAATRLPADVPTTRSGRTPLSSSTWITPMWANPRAAPPPSASPIRSGFGGAGGGGATTTRGSGSGTGGFGAVWQPPSQASAAPATSVRRRGPVWRGSAGGVSTGFAIPGS